jgi:hypothetical protein
VLAVTWLPGDTVAERVVVIAGVIVAVGTIWRAGIRPLIHAWRWVRDTVNEIQVAVDKTQQQTNGELADRFNAIEGTVSARFDTLEQGQAEIRSLVVSADKALALHIELQHPKENP